ncbi:MAG: pilus assembly protein PilM [Oscillospiraceae bacterium]
MLSIDITDRQIKLVRGIHSGNKIRVQDADMREITIGMISNGYITDVPMVAAELNDIIKTKEIKEKDAIVSITSSAIVYKELLIPKPKNIKNTVVIEQMIQAEMGVSKDYNISFTIAGETEDGEKNKMLKVIATACPQRLVDGYIRLFSHIGLSLKAVNVSNNSVTRLILNTPKMADRMPMLLIQIDRGFLNMNLYEDNQLVFSRYFTIDASDYDNAPDYVTRAVYDNLYRMLQFIKNRKDSKPLKEIMFYGDIQNFIELSNAISSFNVPAHILAAPTTVITMTEIDFTQYANAIGAIYRRNKDLEHINLLEATSAKESKGINGFLIGLAAGCLGAVAVVGGICLVLDTVNNSIKTQIQQIDSELSAPALVNDLNIVDQRASMLSGFENYNNTMEQTKLLFNYQPKPISDVLDRLSSSIDKVVDKSKNQKLDIVDFSITGYDIQLKLKGVSHGDPSDVPAKYVEYITESIKDKYGDAYFVDVKYTGYTKDNASENVTYVYLSTEGEKTYDTVFSFDVSMKVKMGNDEENATIDLEPNKDENAQEVTE